MQKSVFVFLSLIFFYYAFAQESGVIELTSENFHNYHNKGNWLIEFNRNGLTSGILENLVEWIKSKSINLGVAKLNIDLYPDIHTILDGSPHAPYPHYILFYNNMAVSFIGSPDFETVSEYVDGFIKKYGNVGQTSEQPTDQVSTEGQTTEQVSTEGQTSEQPTEQVSTEGQTTEQVSTEQTSDQTTEQVSTEGQTSEQPTDQVSAEGQTTEQVSTEGQTGEQPTETNEYANYQYNSEDNANYDSTNLPGDINVEDLPLDENQDFKVTEGGAEQTNDQAQPQVGETLTTEDTTVTQTESVPAPTESGEVDESNVVVLNNSNFEEKTSNGVWFIEFYAPWCGFCKKLIPTWAQLANQLKNEKDVFIAKLDATENDVADKFNIQGYPTLLLIRDGVYYDYEGERDVKSFVNFINEGYKSQTSIPIAKKTELNEEDVVVLNKTNFDSSVSNGVWLVEFYAPWCGFCKRLKPVWAQIATELKPEGINVANVNVDEEADLSSLYNIRYLPTVVVIANKKLYAFEGNKEHKDLVEFARGGYKSVTPSELSPIDFDEKDIFVLTDSNYKEEIKTGTWFIEFYAPWCGFCKKIKPLWAQLASKFKDSTEVKIAMSDSTEHKELAELFGVESYPTIYLYKNGKKYPYSGNRTVEYFTSFVESEWKSVEHKALPLDASKLEEKDVIVLDDANLTAQIAQGEWLIEFYAPWCSFCKNLKPIYSKLATHVKENLSGKFNVAKIDVDQNNKMASVFGIRYLPTIYYVKNGRLYKNNRGRSFDDILKFATENVNSESEVSFPMPIFEENPKFDEKDVIVLTDSNYENEIAKAKHWIIEFYAPWCGHCKRLAPTWAQLASFVKEKVPESGFAIAKIDATANKKFLEKFDDIRGYPTILYVNTETQKYSEYEGGRSIPEFHDFITEDFSKIKEDKFKKIFQSLAEKELAQKDGVEEIAGPEFYDKVSSGIWLVEFYTPWCGFCKNLAPQYDKLNTLVKNEWDSKFHVAKVNVDKEKELGQHFNIEYLPTVFVISEGKAWKFVGKATYDSLLYFFQTNYTNYTPTTFEKKEITKVETPEEKPEQVEPEQQKDANKEVSENDVVVLGDSDFVAGGKISKGVWFVEFYAPWCGFCKQIKPLWAQFATELKAEGGDYNVAMVDATVHEKAATLFEVQGYPTLIVIDNGKFVEFLGGREISEFKSYIKGIYKSQNLKPFKYLDGTEAASSEEKAPAGIEDDSDVVVLKDSNFFNKIAKGTWLVDFYAPWCGHCKQLAPKWNLLAKNLKGKINVGKVDITTEEKLSDSFGPKYLPTIYLIKDGFYYKYDGKREITDLTNFAEVTYKKFDAKKLPPAIMGHDDVSSEFLITLTDENIFSQISQGEWFLEFYTPWCGFCKKLAPIYTQFSFEAHTSIPSLSVAQVNAEENSVADLFKVRGYPTLIFVKDGKYYNFDGLRTVEGMSEFAKGGYKKAEANNVPEAPKVVVNERQHKERKVFTRKVGNIQNLDDSNFDRLTSKGNWLISFNIPYDGFSKQLNNVLSDLDDSSFNIKLSLGSVDSTKSSKLADRFGITKFPNLVLFREDKQYVLDTTINNLPKIKEFVESKYKTSKSTKRTVIKHDEL